MNLRHISLKHGFWGGPQSVPPLDGWRARGTASLIDLNYQTEPAAHPSVNRRESCRPRNWVPRPPTFKNRATNFSAGGSKWPMGGLDGHFARPIRPSMPSIRRLLSLGEKLVGRFLDPRGLPGRASGRASSCAHFLVLREFSIPVGIPKVRSRGVS